jgi:nicotinic acid mononucleotide adenylyltransferase
VDQRRLGVRIAGAWFQYQADDPERPFPKAMFPGAFNPLHIGHRRMSEIASAILGVHPDFELSIANVDKPRLEMSDLERRVHQFPTEQIVWVTAAPTFVQKSRLFPGAAFVVGADTILRIADPLYYEESEARRDQAMAEIERRGCRFLVFGRLVDAAFRTLSELDLPVALRRLCREVPAGKFREDISSTELREQSRTIKDDPHGLP